MRRTSSAILVLLTLTLVAPTGLAAWMSYGSQEPDTALDVQGGYMYPNANTEKVERAYLSVVAVDGRSGVNAGSWVNPNVGALGSRVYPAGKMQFDAIFGSWIDCNLDGYVGHAETLVMEYPSQLLPANTPCTSSGNNDKYNAQGWVSEVRWIRNPYATPASYAGFDSGDPDPHPDGRDARAIQDFGATIWGDFGVPGDTMGREVCPRDRPAGTTQRTGAALNWADCFAGHRLYDNGEPVLDSLGMGFAEEHDFDEAGHPLNINTFGADDGSDTAVQAWDCNAEPVGIEVGPQNVGTPAHQNHTANNQQYTLPWVTVTDEDGELNVTGYNAGNYSGRYGVDTFAAFDPQVPRSVSPGTNAGGSVAGTYNHTNQGMTPTCESRASFYDNFENRNAIQESSSAKNRVTLRFTYYEEQRNGIQQGGMPFYGAFVYAGLRGCGACVVEGTHWYSESTAPSELGAAGPTAPQLVRTSDLQPEGAIYWTFYANMTSQSLSKIQTPKAIPGTYGSEWCSISTDPKLNGGFVCSPSAWYIDPNGDRVPGTEFHPAPGHPYHLRDVDCYDGTVMSSDPVTGTDTSIVKASLAAFSASGGCV